MTEKVGGIEYSIDADTTGLVDAQTKVSAASKKMQDRFIAVDKAVTDLIASEKSLGRTVDNSGKIFTKNGRVLKGQTTKLQALITKQNKLKDAINQASQQQNKLPPIAKKTSNALGGVGKSAGAASIQLQQFFGQVQGGVNPMTALSQQGADLGIVLGAPLIGSVVGISAALASYFIPNIMKSTDTTEDLTKKIKDLRQEYVLTAEQQALIAQSQNKENKEKKKKITEIDKEIKKAKELLKLQESQLESTKKGRTAEAGRRSAPLRIAETTAKIVEYEAERSTLKQEIGDIEKIELATVKKRESIQGSLNKQLAIQKEDLENGANAARRLSVAYEYGVANASLLPQAIKDALTETENLEAAQKKADADRITAAKNQAEIERGIRQQSRDEEIANKKIIAEFDKLNTGMMQGGMTELEKIQADFEAKRELILEHEAILLGDKTLSNEQLIALEQQTSDALQSIDENAAKKREALAKAEQQAKINALGGAFKNLSSLMNTESKKMFEVGKAAAIAGALVDAYSAVTGAYKVGAKTGGPILGAAYAAAAGIAQAVNIQNIAKQKIGGAKSMGAATSFSGGTPMVNTGSGGNQDRNITIAGIDSSSLITGGQLIDTLNQALGDGYSINFAGG